MEIICMHIHLLKTEINDGINNKDEEGNEEFLKYSFDVSPLFLKSQNQGSTILSHQTTSGWILHTLFRKTQDCQWNYAKPLNNYHTFQNKHSMSYNANQILKELHVIQRCFSQWQKYSLHKIVTNWWAVGKTYVSALILWAKWTWISN